MSTDCDKLQDQFSDYFENSLDNADVKLFEVHLANCDACRSDYHVFATMFQFLDRIEVAEVEAPSGLRSTILAEISRRPVQEAFSLTDWLKTVFARPQMVWGTCLATAAVLVTAVIVAIHPVQRPGSTNVESGNLGISSSGPASNSILPLLQSVVLRQGSGRNFEVFTLHTPQPVTSTVNVNAYVLQDGDPVADATMESDADKASPAWSGTLEPNVSVSLPLSVTSDVPAGASLNLLLHWTPEDNSSAGGREVDFVPISAAPPSPPQIAAGTTFYDAVSTIAGEYQQTIVADASALNALPNAPSLSGTTGNELNAEQALDSVLAPAGFSVSVEPGGYYRISHS